MTVLFVWLALDNNISAANAPEDRETPPPSKEKIESPSEESPIHYKTEGSFYLGYRWLNDQNSLKAAEHIYPHSSVTFGLDLLSCPLPFRYHVTAEFLSNYDFYTDAGFAYKDHVLFRDILVGAHHNLDHYSYQYAGEPPDITYTDRNAGDKYYIDFLSNLISLRIKKPDFPLHFFLNHRHVERDGKVQQRFLTGDRNNVYMVSETRDIDWKSNAVKLGTNSHLGPVEIEYAYGQAKFDPGHNNILYDSFTASGSRIADTYPHHVVPETESSSNSLKLHSSYTGGIVTAATISNLYQKNNYSGAESTTWKGSLDFSWIPEPNLGLFFKYRHRTVDTDSPDTVTVYGQSNTLIYSVREGISYDKDIFTLSARYKPLKPLSLFATYEFSYLDRQDVALWPVLPGQTALHRMNFTVHVKPHGKLKMTGSYEYKNYSDPSYNSTPDRSNQLRLTTTYTPTPWVTAYLEYNMSMTERDSLRYYNNSPTVVLETGERDGKHDQLLASLSAALSPKASLTASWFYQYWNIEQDLAYGQWAGVGVSDLPYWDLGVPYTDESNSFSLSLHYLPREDITVLTDVTYTLTEGKSCFRDVVGGAPFALASFSKLKTTQTTFSCEIGKKLSKEWELGVKAYLDFYNDKAYDILDGEVFTTTFRLKRYF